MTPLQEYMNLNQTTTYNETRTDRAIHRDQTR